jgi:hypothetical protein
MTKPPKILPVKILHQIGSRAVSSLERAISAHQSAARKLRSRRSPERIKAEKATFNALAKMVPNDGYEANRYVKYMIRAIPRRTAK